MASIFLKALNGAREIGKYRPQFTALNIPLVVLPCTVSNNVPGTDISIGSDTCLNQIVEVCLQ